MSVSLQELREYTRKVINGKDISKEDVSKIISFYRFKKVKLNEDCLSGDILYAYREWFEAVAKRLPEFGNFALTVPVSSFTLKDLSLGVRNGVFKCLEKMSLPDKAAAAEVANIPVSGITTSTVRPTKILNFKFAGDLRNTEVYKKAANMVPLFEEDLEDRYGKPEYDLNGNCLGVNIQTLYVQSILSAAYRMEIPLLRVITEDPRTLEKKDTVLIDPSARKRLEKILALTPEGVYETAVRNGILDRADADAVNMYKKTILKVAVSRPRRVFDETGEILIRRCLLLEKPETTEDERWFEITR